MDDFDYMGYVYIIYINIFTNRPLRGATAVVIGAGPAHALYFSSYEFTKEKLAKLKINDNINYSKNFFLAIKIYYHIRLLNLFHGCGLLSRIHITFYQQIHVKRLSVTKYYLSFIISLICGQRCIPKL